MKEYMNLQQRKLGERYPAAIEQQAGPPPELVQLLAAQDRTGQRRICDDHSLHAAMVIGSQAPLKQSRMDWGLHGTAPHGL